MSHPSPDNPQVGEAPNDRGVEWAAALYRLHSPAVFAVCLAHTRNHHDAEDLLQAVFMKAITKISDLRDPASVRAWLLQIARRQCADFHRRRKAMEPLVQDPPAPAVAGDPRGERLHAAIQKLPQNYRMAIVLYYLNGRDSASVAAALDATEAAVRQRLVRARAMLHDLLAEERP